MEKRTIICYDITKSKGDRCVQRICEIITSQQISAAAYALTIEAGEIAIQALPGQFLHILCGDGDMLRRPISISDVSGTQIKIVFDVVGKGTKWLSEKKSGCLDIIGPLGNGYDFAAGNTLLVGGGIGVPPLLYAAREALGVVDAVLGFRSREHVILEDQFRSLCKKVHITTDDGSYGESGSVTAPVERFLASGDYETVLACGPRPMLRCVAKLCQSFGVRCQISLEERMGCGIGACLVCACRLESEYVSRYAHVCKDGPVFEASEVVWDE